MSVTRDRAQLQSLAGRLIAAIDIAEVIERYDAACAAFSGNATDDNRRAIQRIGEEIADELIGAAQYGAAGVGAAWAEPARRELS